MVDVVASACKHEAVGSECLAGCNRLLDDGSGSGDVARPVKWVPLSVSTVCTFVWHGRVKAEYQRVVKEIGLLESFMEVRALLAPNGPQGPRRRGVRLVGNRKAWGAGCGPIALRRPTPPQLLPRRDLRGVALNLTGCAGLVRATVPVAFQSALAGIMSAAEPVKHSAGLSDASTTTTRINLLRPLRGHYADPKAKASPAHCICGDLDLIQAHRRKYEVAACASSGSKMARPIRSQRQAISEGGLGSSFFAFFPSETLRKFRTN